MPRRLVVSLLFVVIAALVAIPAADAAKKKKFASEISLEHSAEEGAFIGEVDSKVTRCVRGRSVTVSADFGGDEPVPYGTDRTDAQGRYAVPGQPFPGAVTYVAVVERKASAKTVCRGARRSS